MAGFPPSAADQVTLANWRKAPFNKWSFTHLRELIPSAAIANDPDDVAELPSAPVDFGGLEIELDGSRNTTSRRFLAETDTDGMIVLRDGRHGPRALRKPGMDMPRPRTFFASVTKSVLGRVAGVLAGSGVLATDRPVTEWIPEVAETAWAGASLRDLLDMRAGILFDEDYLATSGAIIEYRKAQGWDPLAPGEEPSDLRTWFRSLTEPDGSHGGAFHYVSPNTDLLGWVIERAAGRRYTDLVSELLWRPMGATADAYITVDRLGAPRAAGGMCATLRDLALVGQLVANRGHRDGRQIVPADWIDDILTGGDPAAWDAGDFAPYFPGMEAHYRSKWYVAPRRCPDGLRGGGLRPERLRRSGERNRDRQDVVAGASPRRAPHRPHHARRRRGDATSHGRLRPAPGSHWRRRIRAISPSLPAGANPAARASLPGRRGSSAAVVPPGSTESRFRVPRGSP